MISVDAKHSGHCGGQFLNYQFYLINFAEESAEGEPAWEGSGQGVGTQIWRIEVWID